MSISPKCTERHQKVDTGYFNLIYPNDIKNCLIMFSVRKRDYIDIELWTYLSLFRKNPRVSHKQITNQLLKNNDILSNAHEYNKAKNY